MKMVIFTNDGYFPYLLAKPLFREFHKQITMVIFSQGTTSSISKILGIYRKSYPGYFFYRSLVELISRWNRLFRKKSIAHLADHYSIEKSYQVDVNHRKIVEDLSADIGLAFNLDQIIKPQLLSCFQYGILNIHGSRLPDDKGISPVLWAFARGERSIWTSIYQMDEGMDTGPIYTQFCLPVEEGDTAFSFSEKLGVLCGEKLITTVKNIIEDNIQPLEQEKSSSSTVWSWPDRSHQKMMAASHRSFIRLQDVIRAIK